MTQRSLGDTNSDSRPTLDRAGESPIRRTLRAFLFATALFMAWSAMFILYPSGERVKVVVGEPSPRDVKAPRQVIYESEVKTAEARATAAAQVMDIYTMPDMSIATRRLRAFQDIADYITAIRHDQFMGREQKLILLREIPSINLSSGMFLRILELDENSWQDVVHETSRVLDTIMREEIRADQIEDARQKVRRLTSLALSEDLRAIVVGIAQNLIAPNSFYDAEQTIARRNAARETVKAVPWTIREGESIIREGEIVTELALEKLRVLGLLSTRGRWQWAVGAVLFSLALVLTLSLYVARSYPLLMSRPRRELLILLTLIGAGLGARILISGPTLTAYLFPAAAAVMLLATLLDVQLAAVTSAIVAILVGFSAGGSLELVVYAFVGSMIGALSLGNTDHLGTFARSAALVALANVIVAFGFRLRSDRALDMAGSLQLLAVSIGNGIIASSLALVAVAFIGKLFGIATPFQLLELARPNHPLFRQLLTKAPGTYHHSIIVSNMAERAAEAIGADALLARVGSYYHDVGKIIRPYFFVENQTNGDNPHDKLDPKTSAEIIIAHTTEGLELAHRYGVPERVCDFIPEHHGTTLVTYFYQRANQENGDGSVSEDDFRYLGPKPQSRETAIVMLADGIEAYVRAKRPSTPTEMERAIRQIINGRLVSGELDECDLTLKDLDTIREAFFSVLQGVFHPRIQYPERALRDHRDAEKSA